MIPFLPFDYRWSTRMMDDNWTLSDKERGEKMNNLKGIGLMSSGKILNMMC